MVDMILNLILNELGMILDEVGIILIEMSGSRIGCRMSVSVSTRQHEGAPSTGDALGGKCLPSEHTSSL